jgi:hypothetical protein
MSKTKTVVTIIKAVAAQDRLFATISNNLRSVEKDMHTAACSVLWHVGQHKDIRQVDKLIAALEGADGGAVRINALRAWFETFGPISFADNKTTFVKNKATQLGIAQETPFWQFKPEPAYKPVDTLVMLDSMVKKLTTDQDKAGADHSALLRDLQALKTAENKRREAAVLAERAREAAASKAKGAPKASRQGKMPLSPAAVVAQVPQGATAH